MNKLFIALFTLHTFHLHAITILIDPGHGGEDHGAETYYYYKKGKRKKIREKDIALQLAKKIQQKLSKKHQAFLTRSLDRTVSLEERSKMADKLKADLYISVHLNSSTKKTPRGFETYYLDNHKDSAIQKVEKIENSSLKGEDLEVKKILIDLVIKRTVTASKSLASNIHQEIQKLVGARYKLKNRGVKPGLFYVLALAKRPAVLLEVGFLSNSKELKKILSRKFQDRYAEAVTRGVHQYLKIKKQKKGPTLF